MSKRVTSTSLNNIKGGIKLEETIQFYKDKEQTIKRYPITTADRVVVNDIKLDKKINDLESSLDNMTQENNSFKTEMNSKFGNIVIDIEKSKTDFDTNTHKSLNNRLISDFTKVYNKINKATLVHYEGEDIKAYESYLGKCSNVILNGATDKNLNGVGEINQDGLYDIDIVSEGKNLIDIKDLDHDTGFSNTFKLTKGVYVYQRYNTSFSTSNEISVYVDGTYIKIGTSINNECVEYISGGTGYGDTKIVFKVKKESMFRTRLSDIISQPTATLQLQRVDENATNIVKEYEYSKPQTLNIKLNNPLYDKNHIDFNKSLLIEKVNKIVITDDIIATPPKISNGSDANNFVAEFKYEHNFKIPLNNSIVTTNSIFTRIYKESVWVRGENKIGILSNAIEFSFTKQSVIDMFGEFNKDNAILFIKTLFPIIVIYNLETVNETEIQTDSIKCHEKYTNIYTTNTIKPIISVDIPSNTNALIQNLTGEVSTLSLENEELKTTTNEQSREIENLNNVTDYLVSEMLMSMNEL